VTISLRHDQYSVGDVIACSARGFPAPEIRWSRDDDDDVTVTSHANLSVSADMLETIVGHAVHRTNSTTDSLPH